MTLFYYLGKAHTVWCDWQGHSNGRLRIQGKRTDGSVDFVFSASWYKFYFYVFRRKLNDREPFRKLHIGNHVIFFTRKWKRELYYMKNRLANAHYEIAELKEVLELHKQKMYEILEKLDTHKYVEYDEPINIEHHIDDTRTKENNSFMAHPRREYITICRM